MADAPPCPMRAQNHPHDTHECHAGEGRCPGYGEPEEFAPEPAPPQTAGQIRRDLEYVIQRVREAVGTDQPAIPVEPVDSRLAAIVREVLGIDLTAGTPHVAAALFIACRELAKSDAAREHLRRDRAEARNWARHGYEIGQRHCGWSDHGVAPAWLTEGWPRSFGSCEHATQAAEYDTALTRVRGLADRPEAVDPNCPYSDDYLLGYRMAISTTKSVASNERVVIKDAEPDAVCSVCGDEHAPYRDHRKQPFCAACVNCTCRKTVCVRTTAPPTTPAAATGDE